MGRQGPPSPLWGTLLDQADRCRAAGGVTGRRLGLTLESHTSHRSSGNRGRSWAISLRNGAAIGLGVGRKLNRRFLIALAVTAGILWLTVLWIATGKMPAPLTERDRADALGTADRFLHAWQQGDGRTGESLCSPGLQRRWGPARLGRYLREPAAGRMRAYEVRSGRRLSPGMYAFITILYEYESAGRWVRRPRLTRIRLVRGGLGRWLVEDPP